jgi:hypothetical protein
MITCPVCQTEFPITSEKNIFSAPIIHETDKNHRFRFKNRKIFLERFYKILLEEEISPEESGESLGFEDPENVPCFFCGTIKDPCECGFCGVVTCRDCWDDHDELLLDVQQDRDN